MAATGSGNSTAFLNRVLGGVWNDLGYLFDEGVISEQVYDEITGKLPRRVKAEGNKNRTNTETDSRKSADVSVEEVTQAVRTSLNVSHSDHDSISEQRKSAVVERVASPQQIENTVQLQQPERNVPQPPQQPPRRQMPPIIGYCETLYEYRSNDAGDLNFRPGEKIAIVAYENSDWWRGFIGDRMGLFPSNYVRRIYDGNAPPQTAVYPPLYNPPLNMNPNIPPPGYAVAVQQREELQKVEPQPIVVAEPQPSNTGDKFANGAKKHGSKFGNAAVFGAGATLGSEIMRNLSPF